MKSVLVLIVLVVTNVSLARSARPLKYPKKVNRSYTRSGYLAARPIYASHGVVDTRWQPHPVLYSDSKKTFVRKPVFTFEARPSLDLSNETWRSDDYGEIGIPLNENVSVGYQQQFTQLLQSDEAGMFVLGDGFLRAKANNLVTMPEQGFSFGYEPRLYFPTDEAKRDNGMILAIRNYLKFKKKLSSVLSLSFFEVPIIHIYSRSGTADPTLEVVPDSQKANPVFENRGFLILEASSGDVYFGFSFIHAMTRFSDFDDSVENSGDWQHRLWIYPELTFNVLPVLALGVAYESGSFVEKDFGSFDMGNAFRTGTFQGIFSLSF